MKERKKNEQKEHKPNWKEYTATVEEIQDFLMDHVPLRHNVITGRVEYRDGDMWQPITDRIVNSLWSELSQVKKVRIDDLHRVIGSDFVPDFHPFRYYLDGLPPWDGQNHILAMSVSVNVKGGVEEQMLFSEYLTKWLVGMVAGWVDDTVVNNVILVLIGEQAYALYRRGFRFWFSREEIAKLSNHNAAFEVPQIERELISERFRPPHEGEAGEFVTSTYILQSIGGNLVQKLNANKVGRAMTDLGFRRMRSHGERGYVVVAYSAEEIRARKRIKAHDAQPESAPNDDTFDTNDTIF